jgi:hypothetical protein
VTENTSRCDSDHVVFERASEFSRHFTIRRTCPQDWQPLKALADAHHVRM